MLTESGLKIKETPQYGFYAKYIKRILDFIFALLLLIMTSPVLFVAAIAIKLEDPEGPVLFKQDRPGKDGKIFKLIKLRTMRIDLYKDGRRLSDNERLTRVGSFLRKTSIDELPQLINILKGDMSFIGPRPLLTKYLPYYTVEEMKRHTVLPGISGWAQVNGRNSISWEEKFKFDIEYVENLSLKLDAKIFLLTIKKIFMGSDVKVNALPDFDEERKRKIKA